MISVRTKEWLTKKDQIGRCAMKSYISTFDWNNGEEINPWDWLWDDEDRSLKPSNRARTISIRKK